MKSYMSFFALSASAIALAGCQSLSTSAKLKFEDQVVGHLDLINLVDPERRRFKIQGPCHREDDKFTHVPNASAPIVEDAEPWRPSVATEFTCALNAFPTYYLSASEFEYFVKLEPGTKALEPGLDGFNRELGKLRGWNNEIYKEGAKGIALSIRRNDIQDTILLHSTGVCSDFKADLADPSTAVNFFTDFVSQYASSASIGITDPTILRVLAGTSTVAQDARTSFNSRVLNEAAVRTINAGIDLAREEVLIEINRQRFFIFQPDEFEGDSAQDPFDPQIRSYRGISAILGWDKASKTLNVVRGDIDPVEDGFIVKILDDQASDQWEPKYKDGPRIDEPEIPDNPDDPKKGSPFKKRDRGPDSSAKRFGMTSIARYSLEAAMRDALAYHGQCRIDAGLEAASKAIEEAQKTNQQILDGGSTGNASQENGSNGGGNEGGGGDRDGNGGSSKPKPTKKSDMTREY